jgi:hypothetical protein
MVAAAETMKISMRKTMMIMMKTKTRELAAVTRTKIGMKDTKTRMSMKIQAMKGMTIGTTMKTITTEEERGAAAEDIHRVAEEAQVAATAPGGDLPAWIPTNKGE